MNLLLHWPYRLTARCRGIACNGNVDWTDIEVKAGYLMACVLLTDAVAHCATQRLARY